jgi:hypothetical protein
MRLTSTKRSFTEYLAARYGKDWLYQVVGTKDDRKIFQRMRYLEDFQYFINEERKIEREVEQRVKPPQALREWHLDHVADYERFKELYDAYHM